MLGVPVPRARDADRDVERVRTAFTVPELERLLGVSARLGVPGGAVCARYLTGRFELKHNDPRVKERMFVDKNEPTTNTGEGLTSLKAWFGQQSAGFSV